MYPDELSRVLVYWFGRS